MKKTASLLAGGILLCLLISCGKNYNCVCTNPGGSEVVAKYHSTKTKAENKCRAYYDSKYGEVPMSETYCEIK
jgi:hypothetical protein